MHVATACGAHTRIHHSTDPASSPRPAPLAQAVLWAGELSRFAAERCDARGALEAEAYACWMAGNLQLEKEADWELGLAKFTRAKWGLGLNPRGLGFCEAEP